MTFQIEEVTQNSPENLKEELVVLNKEFLQALAIDQNRPEANIRSALNNQLRPESPTGTFIALDENDQLAGMTYFNRGSGIACKGDYIWVNAVYVRQQYRKTGCAKAILDAIENHAKATHCTLLISCRDIENNASQKLFEKAGYNQDENIIMKKTFNRENCFGNSSHNTNYSLD